MTSRTHDIIAFSSLVTLAGINPPLSLNVPTLFACMVGNIVGSLLPDVDQATNRLWDLLPGGNITGRIFKKLFLSHRTLSHSLVGMFLFYKGLEWVLPKVFNPGFINPQLVLISIMVGLISHLVADSLTEDGIPLFFPLKIKIGFPPIPSWRIKTGHWFEKYVVFPGVLVYLLWFVTKNHQLYLAIFKTMN